MPNKKDMAGQKFERLRILKFAGLNKNGCALWVCLCDCGKTKTLIGSVLRNGMTKSCGCLRDEKVRQRIIKISYKHGMTNSKEYMIWCSMKQRCENKKNKDYRLYGARGIKVCEKCHEFKKFMEDMGERPGKKYSIDRINNDGDYEPANCRWATPKEQANNSNRWSRGIIEKERNNNI